MNLWINIVIYIVLGASIIPLIVGKLKRNHGNQKILLAILSVIISFNAIWYSVLLIEFVQSKLTFSPYFTQAVNVISATLMFLIRFIYLIMFMKLFQLLLDFKLTKRFYTGLKISGIAILGIWILGLVEFFILHSHIVTSNLLLYTDILIFFVVIVSCFYLIYQVKLIYAPRIQKAVKQLAMIFLIPMILAFLKWLAGDMMDENSVRERLSIPFLVFIMNALISIWIIEFGNSLHEFKTLKTRKKLASELIEKYKISKRETEVIQLICEGYTNKQIADELFISIETVKDHNSRIFLKTEVKNRTQLAKLFL